MPVVVAGVVADDVPPHRAVVVGLVLADRGRVAGNLELDDGLHTDGTVRLPNATVGGYLRLSGARLSGPFGASERGIALLADGMEVGGDLEGRDHGRGAQQQAERADQAGLLGQHGEHEIGVLLGQEAELALGALEEAAAEHAAGAERDGTVGAAPADGIERDRTSGDIDAAIHVKPPAGQVHAPRRRQPQVRARRDMDGARAGHRQHHCHQAQQRNPQQRF